MTNPIQTRPDESRLDYLKRKFTRLCPDHGEPVAKSILRATFFCPMHNRVWYIRTVNDIQQWKCEAEIKWHLL